MVDFVEQQLLGVGRDGEFIDRLLKVRRATTHLDFQLDFAFESSLLTALAFGDIVL